MNNLKIELVVTRHPALLEYLQAIGLATEQTLVVSHATKEDIQGKDVCGVLPHSLSCFCNTFTEIPLNLTPEMRGKELNLKELWAIAMPAKTYIIKEIAETGRI